MPKEIVKINFIDSKGNLQCIQAETGQSLMQAAIFNNIDGVEAECGGSCMCATCHIYTPDSSLLVNQKISEDEDEMLEETAAPRMKNSRLSCQLTISKEMDGLTFKVPEIQ
tara:strand:- start:3338 stop:3670 length:333 start_codon:yes stop_codon:yes gene_type:complete